MVGVAAVALPFVASLVDLLAGQPTIHAWGDSALIELAVREAAQGDQLLGAYSRYGWFHPGPSYFYGLAPFWVAAGGETWGIYAGVAVLNGASAAAVVALVHRHGAPRLALAAAALVLAHLASIEPFDYLDVWNPRAVLLPLMLYCVLCAVGPASAGATLAAAVLGSVLVQTHVGMIPIFAGLAAVTLGLRLLPWSGWPPERRTLAWGVAGAAVVGLAWALPLLQELHGSPGNLTVIVEFVRSDQPGPTVDAAVSAVGRELSRFVIGPVDGAWAQRAVLAAYLALSTAVAVVGGRRGDRLARHLGVVGAVAMVVAVVAVASITGTIETYLVLWVSVLPVVPLLGLAQLARLPGAPRRWPSWAVVVAVAVLAATQTVRLATFPERRWSVPAVAAMAGLARSVLDPDEGRVAIDVTASPQFANAAGVALALVEAGFDVRVGPRSSFMFDARFASAGHEPQQIVLAEPDRAALDGYVLAGTTGAGKVFVRRSP